MLFILAMDKEWLDYIFASLHDTIHHIIWYLKINPLKIMHARWNASNQAYPNKQRLVALASTSSSTLSLSPCKNLIYLTKKSWYTIYKCWKSYLELRSIRQQNPDSSDIKIKDLALTRLPPFDIHTFETSWLPKILAMTTLTHNF